MDILPGQEAAFLAIFEGVKRDIASREGCLSLEILQHQTEANTSLWTISVWDSAESLDRYRDSPLFQQTWASVKPFFSGKASAWTLSSIEIVK